MDRFHHGRQQEPRFASGDFNSNRMKEISLCLRVVLFDVPLLFIFDNATLLGIAAIISATTGIATTIMGSKRARKEEHDKDEEQCRERLKAARKEAEEAAMELHARKMKYGN